MQKRINWAKGAEIYQGPFRKQQNQLEIAQYIIRAMRYFG